MVHPGIVLITLGVTGSSVYQTETQVTLAPEESAVHRGYTLEYEGLAGERGEARQRVAAVLAVYRRGKRIATLRPEKNFYWNVEQWIGEVAVRSTLEEDLYVILVGVERDGLATFRVLSNPLLAWLWVGGAMLLAGGLMAWWPSVSGVETVTQVSIHDTTGKSRLIAS